MNTNECSWSDAIIFNKSMFIVPCISMNYVHRLIMKDKMPINYNVFVTQKPSTKFNRNIYFVILYIILTIKTSYLRFNRKANEEYLHDID